MPSPPCPTERGSAAVEFVLVAPLVVAVCVGVLHLGAWAVAVTRAQRIAFDTAHDQAAGRSRSAATDIARRELPADALVTSRESAGAVEVEVRIPMRIMGWPVWAEARGRMPREP